MKTILWMFSPGKMIRFGGGLRWNILTREDHFRRQLDRRMCVILARLKYNFSVVFLEETEPYFKIEQALPVEELASLQSPFCAMDYDAMLQDAPVICRFYQDVAPGLAEAHNLPYQTDLE
jgi:hypothetical protein